MNQKKPQKTNKFKKLILAGVMLMMSLIALVGATWAYWDTLQVTEKEVITIGYGDEVIVSESTASSTKELVPTTITPDSTETNSIVYTYTVGINQSAFDAGNKKLIVTIDNVKIGESTTYISLVHFDINTPSHTFSSTIETIQVTVTIELTEPGDQTVYNAIAGKSITFDVVFTGTIA